MIEVQSGPEPARSRRGRQRVVNDEVAKEVCEFMKLGYTTLQSLKLVGVSKSTWYRWLDEHPEQWDALTRARAELARDAATTFYQKVTEALSFGDWRGALAKFRMVLSQLERQLADEPDTRIDDDRLVEVVEVVAEEVKRYLERQRDGRAGDEAPGPNGTEPVHPAEAAASPARAAAGLRG